jgi:hypothetical protein
MASSARDVKIFAPMIIALPTILATIVIHGLALLAVVYFVRHQRRAGRAGLGFWSDLVIVSAATLLALTAHLIDVAIWALVFELCGEFPHLSAAVYHSAANYTSLGDDVLISAAWRFLGPLETADGMLMFGVSTAMIFAVIERLVQLKFKFE